MILKAHYKGSTMHFCTVRFRALDENVAFFSDNIGRGALQGEVIAARALHYTQTSPCSRINIRICRDSESDTDRHA